MEHKQTRACWYVIQCKGGESFRAAENLENQGFEIFHPTLRLRKKRQGSLCWVTEPLFPFYLFIRLNQATSNWGPIRSTRGVAKLVSFGHVPAQVPDDLISSLQSQHNLAALHTAEAPLIKPGETVSIAEGPFSGREAVFSQALFNQKSGEKRAMLLIELLNRTQHISVPMDHLSLKD
ncbi:transcription/translation regulatory transformer protein RfaH [Halomonas sp. 7T]|uniref:transcription/translation regulatory transformer protein RfaH n=1 Tax=Halomonas sp. 7T TaxID=2893469 RepID=UPI0021D9A874|nr:transcription/translation regulatory transformer protein RfaH [Halomonas sp. 7T]UXZ55050.1 transcription/translation regulatory transformer protein RfaH [Halomonas sp. 7T]